MSDQVKRFTKIGADGESLPDDAKQWEAVLDNTTGLEWSVADHEVENYADAITAAEAVTVGGYKDWRLPTVDELFALADRTRFAPAINTDFFPDCKSSWYWTGTPAAPSPGGCEWYVDFNGGDASWDFHGDGGFVRAVRGSQ